MINQDAQVYVKSAKEKILTFSARRKKLWKSLELH